MSRIAYHLIDTGVSRSLPDAAERAMYQDHLIVHRFGDVWGYVVREEDGLLQVEGTLFSSSCDSDWPLVNDFLIGGTDGGNGSWAPSPQGSLPEYVGVRFESPIRVTGFQFSTGVYSPEDCPGGADRAPIPRPLSWRPRTDESAWTELLSVTGYRGMRVADSSPFPDEDLSAYAGRIFLSDRMDVQNDLFFLAYRMRVEDAVTDVSGYYNVSELIFYGQDSDPVGRKGVGAAFQDMAGSDATLFDPFRPYPLPVVRDEKRGLRRAYVAGAGGRGMSQLYDYLLAQEAASETRPGRFGPVCLYLNVAATGTCGVTTRGTFPCDGVVPGGEDQDGYDPAEGGCTGIVLPGLIASGVAVCAHAARVVLPALECRALGPEWFPAVGEAVLSLAEVSGTARTLVASVSALPPLFALAWAGARPAQRCPARGRRRDGAVAELSLPGVWTILSASGLDRLADGQADLPVPRWRPTSAAWPIPWSGALRPPPWCGCSTGTARSFPFWPSPCRELEDTDDRASALLYAVSNR
jgi:hypothetical protein